jgi:predicted DnaQ family exonuclease/DinG family helicase
MTKTHIALDLETTGFDPYSDQVIEIAAVKFTDGQITDRFESLINPQVEIPPMITHITGIKPSDLVDAPLFSDISERLVNFIGGYPIVGHNISFDISFLNGKGLKLLNPLYDTLQLSSILLPGLASYSLDTLTRVLKIRHENKHRAMSDAIASMELFLLLEEKISGINPGLHGEIMEILGKSTWELHGLFSQIKPSAKAGRHKTGIAKKKKNASLAQTAPPNAIKAGDLEKIYLPEGILAKNLEDYESRPMQERMTGLILEAFANNGSLLVEAGTGTGKTLAYLLAGVYRSLAHGEKVVVSTHTKNLQEQIIKKDLPLLAKILGKLDPPVVFEAANLKGRRNYLSLKRLEAFLRKDFFMDHEVTVLLKVLLWLEKTTTGDLEELSLQGKEYSVLDDLCCAEYVCRHDDPEYAAGCYLMKARQNAESANIIVVNHALLLQDSLADSPLMPEAGRLIVDEAHHLERVATESLTVSISYHNFIRPFEKTLKLLDEMQRSPADLFSAAGPDLPKQFKASAQQLVSRIDIFFGLLGIFMEKNLEPSDFQYHLNLNPYHFNTPDWQKVQKSASAIAEAGLEFISGLNKLQEARADSATDGRELKNLAYECERRLKDLGKSMPDALPGEGSATAQKNGGSPGPRISWLFKSPEGGVSLKSAPESIGETLRTILFDKKDSIILTSATLQTGGSFNFIREQLSLDASFGEHILPSHFDFPDQVKILIPEDLPEPATEGYFLSCAGLIANVIRKNRGRTLVLFTSKKALAATYHEIAPQLKEQGFTVLAQNITGGRGKILEHFKDEPGNCAILGTASFWEGVDIKGGDLTCVIMQKLPFDPPEDPIILARSRKYHDSFSQYQLPRAILKFKQGFGRLIRSSRDTGSIIILDTRIIRKSYGQQFLESLPGGIKIGYAPESRLAELL